MGVRIYTAKLSALYIIMIAATLLWTGTNYAVKNRKQWKKLWMRVNGVLAVVGLYGILYFTVLGRAPSDTHILNFASKYGPEFYREMLMNAFLYFPFGLTISTILGPWSILFSFFLSISVELWQYFAGTGVAQGSDVIMNTLGCAIGFIPWVITYITLKRENSKLIV